MDDVNPLTHFDLNIHVNVGRCLMNQPVIYILEIKDAIDDYK